MSENATRNASVRLLANLSRAAVLSVGGSGMMAVMAVMAMVEYQGIFPIRLLLRGADGLRSSLDVKQYSILIYRVMSPSRGLNPKHYLGYELPCLEARGERGCFDRPIRQNSHI